MTGSDGSVEPIVAALQAGRAALDGLLGSHETLATIARAGSDLADCLVRGGRVISCGNGGSMADAIHFAEELSGRFQRERPALAAVAISDPGHLTCVANDYGYDQVFSRYVLAHGRSGDILLAISTSGSSPNVLRAAEAARGQKMIVIALTGRTDAALGSHAHHHIATPGGGPYSDRVQELHIKVIHILVELVERRLFPQNYASRG